jgi:DNA topoisomerase-1
MLSTRRKYTKHADRFNASSLIRKMEQEKIGTKATRSNIVETLYRRGYIRGQQIAVTSLGENIIETLMRYSPEIIEVKLTRDLEEEIEDIEAGKKGSDTVFNDVVEELKPILAQFKLSEEEIGKTLSNAIKGKASNHSNKACKVCRRDKLDGSVFCARHTVAYMNIEAGFQKWRYALGYQWREYLEKLSKNTGTGVYAKEIIKDIIG